MLDCDVLYINTNEHYRAKVVTETREARFNKWIQEKYPNKNIERSNPILQNLTKSGSTWFISFLKSGITTIFFIGLIL